MSPNKLIKVELRGPRQRHGVIDPHIDYVKLEKMRKSVDAAKPGLAALDKKI